MPRSPTEALQPVAAPPPPPPPPEKRRRPFINFLSGMFSLVMVLAVLAGAALFIGKIQFYAPGPLASDKVVTVKGGMTDVADQLRQEGIIEHPLLFMAGLQILGNSSKLKAGEYQFKQNASLSDVMQTLVEGRSILHTVTIPEGLTSQQIVDRLRENDVLSGDVTDIPAEGTLLPDTYKFARGMSRAQLLDRMAQEQEKVLKEVWSRRTGDLPVKSPKDMVVLASIVEKETGRADERSRVAAVFINRLNRNMKLQSDPTIVYGLVGGQGTLGRGILRSEIEKPTPYNTYVIAGLPPTPIANPGRAALEAVASPSRTRELYFVADGTGGHVFAETLDQHQKNVTKWRQIEGDKRDAAPADALPGAPGGSAPGLRGDAGQAADPAAVLPPVSPSGPPTQRKVRSGTTKAPADLGIGDMPYAAIPSASAYNSGPRGNLDAVAGTPKDPILNRTFDLNSPKTVPAIPQ
jgi:UPF0755 protein